uniref:NADH dehydrogenase subunit 6 n=1 Tax=Rhinebothrium sp. LRP 10405 TaxID=2899468 RepID=A0A8K1SWQ9_9CEST|nr:NADH dehydrogenase subunit 6 [Rhinebothrium sp. LRP 10405]
MLLSFCLLSYFLCLVTFSLISHPVYYCVLLVLNAMLCSSICYFSFGFSWYSLLFCLVYIGGVYILFVFVSVHSPNTSSMTYWQFSPVVWFILIFMCITFGSLLSFTLVSAEFSSYLCTITEGSFYTCMCLTLLFGFIMLSLVMCVKINHYR